MPKFLYWCAPLVFLFVASVFFGLSETIIKTTFFMAFLGLLVELVRSIIIAKETPVNKRSREKVNYF
jgi:hypothetical protein